MALCTLTCKDFEMYNLKDNKENKMKWNGSVKGNISSPLGNHELFSGGKGFDSNPDDLV